MKINVNNQEVEAYRLIMKKENAKDIVSGKKKLEVRNYNNIYCGMFLDKKKFEEYLKDLEDPNGTMALSDAVKDTKYIRFTNYNGSWHLDVSIDFIEPFEMSKENVEAIGQNYNFHDFDDQWQEFEDLSQEEKPFFFGIVIDKVINRHNI
ncbi:hypothetical protein [Ornithobacterium rhinotracheale]|uniref:hypothetical protein n=1 Tax=Ornithobacterium rhinotracheale TaxID=28251 RepID=UPI001FF2EA19|nr:hypothetical protein [Ornithobacterium rhinotracheale]MCK0201352.1 hypothetical protein [Ornithobacterium rhinotracheale]